MTAKLGTVGEYVYVEGKLLKPVVIARVNLWVGASVVLTVKKNIDCK